MAFLVLDKETDEMVDVLYDLSPEEIEEYELKNPDKYIQDEDDLEDDDFDGIDYDDLW